MRFEFCAHCSVNVPEAYVPAVMRRVVWLFLSGCFFWWGWLEQWARVISLVVVVVVVMVQTRCQLHLLLVALGCCQVTQIKQRFF